MLGLVLFTFGSYIDGNSGTQLKAGMPAVTDSTSAYTLSLHVCSWAPLPYLKSCTLHTSEARSRGRLLLYKHLYWPLPFTRRLNLANFGISIETSAGCNQTTIVAKRFKLQYLRWRIRRNSAQAGYDIRRHRHCR
jgi:hypothetical protein